MFAIKYSWTLTLLSSLPATTHRFWRYFWNQANVPVVSSEHFFKIRQRSNEGQWCPQNPLRDSPISCHKKFCDITKLSDTKLMGTWKSLPSQKSIDVNNFAMQNLWNHKTERQKIFVMGPSCDNTTLCDFFISITKFLCRSVLWRYQNSYRSIETFLDMDNLQGGSSKTETKSKSYPMGNETYSPPLVMWNSP